VTDNIATPSICFTLALTYAAIMCVCVCVQRNRLNACALRQRELFDGNMQFALFIWHAVNNQSIEINTQPTRTLPETGAARGNARVSL